MRWYILYMETTSQINLSVSQAAYDRYISKKNVISNKRVRPENETFLDAMLSVDMTATPEGREILDIIRKLN
jgi:hypothetical protein